MLGNKYSLTLKRGEEIIECKCNFKFIRNLFNYIEEDPIDYLNNINSSKDKIKIIIQCMSNGLYNLDFLQEEDFSAITKGLEELINKEFSFEVEEKIDKEDIKNKRNFNFKSWWNKWYFIGTRILKMSEEEFLNSSVRELFEMEKLNNEYYKNILIGAYVDILKAKNNSIIKNNTISTKNNRRLKNLL